MEISPSDGSRVIVDREVGGSALAPGSCGPEPAMIPVPGGLHVWLASGVTHMRRGMNKLALQVQEDLGRDPHAGDFYIFRGRRGGLVKILRSDGVGTSLFAKRLERGRFQWPVMPGGAVAILSRLPTAVDLCCRGDAQLRLCHDRVAARQSHPLPSRSDHCRDCAPSL